MNWLNIYTPILRSPEFIGSEPVARATWLSILAHCVEQENGGIIQGCADWKDRQWQQTCGVTRQEVDEANLLCRWEGDDLWVFAYPHDKEAEVKAKRDGGRKGGQSKTQAKTEAARANGAKHNPTKTQAEPKLDPSSDPTEGKGREGNRREEEEKGKHTSAVPALVCVAEKTLPEKTALQIRAEKLFNRRLSTAWGKTDAKAWASASKAIEATHEDDWALLEWFYARPPSEPTYRRRDLATLLNNWNAEIDRAREYRAKQFSTPAFDKPRRAENLPPQIA
jgi:hypothetical protein